MVKLDKSYGQNHLTNRILWEVLWSLVSLRGGCKELGDQAIHPTTMVPRLGFGCRVDLFV